MRVEPEPLCSKNCNQEIGKTDQCDHDPDGHRKIARPIDSDLRCSQPKPGIDERLCIPDETFAVCDIGGRVDTADRSRGDDMRGQSCVLKCKQRPAW